MAIYIKFEGIDGDATQQDHKKWWDVQSLQWGVSRGVSTPSGSAQNREASEPNVSEVTITKMMDSATAKIFQEVTAGNVGKKVTIHLVTTSSPGKVYMEYILSNTLVSGYSISSGGDRPSEAVSMNFSKIETKYTQYNEKNEAVGNMPASYDLATTVKT